MHFLVCVLASIALGCSALEYTEVFRDDFNDGLIDPAKWNVITRASDVNKELQHYVWDEVWEENGMLVIRSQKRNYGGRLYTGGRIDTQHKYQFLYGEVEWQAKFPAGAGIWPALWLVHFDCPAATTCGTWPPEIDVVEMRGDQPNKITTTIHYGRWPNNAYDTHDTYGPDYTADFHRFKVLWDPNQIIWYIDGVEVYNVTDTNKIPHEPLYLIMNVAVGGWFGAQPDATTPFPNYMHVDWVTVHKWQ